MSTVQENENDEGAEGGERPEDYEVKGNFAVPGETTSYRSYLTNHAFFTAPC